MSTSRPARLAGVRLRAVMPLFLVGMALGGTLGACGSGQPAPAERPAAEGPGAAGAAVPAGSMTMPTAAQAEAAWDARPDYVRQLPDAGQAAYRFALARPDVLQWLPCYCGCGGMGHESNLDCFFAGREAAGTFTWEEHASYCDICIRTANLAQQMLGEGSTIAEVRAAVDAQFGNGGVPGTDTPLPPSA